MKCGYVLAKDGNKFLVMEDRFYKTELLNRDWECKNNLDKLEECTLDREVSFPKILNLDKYDYKVKYDEKNKIIVGCVLKENGEPESKAKKVYMLGHYASTNKKGSHIFLMCSKAGSHCGYKNNFEPNEGIDRKDLFLSCLMSDSDKKIFIGYAKMINGWHKDNKYKENMLSKRIPDKVAEEAFYQNAQGKDVRFGVLSGYFIDKNNKKSITEACIDDTVYFPVNLLEKDLYNAWSTYSVNSKTNNCLYKIPVAYYINNKKEITKVVDALDIIDEVVEKSTGLNILWKKYTFNELSYKESSNVQKMCLKLEAGETLNTEDGEIEEADFFLKTKMYAGEDIITRQRIKYTLNKKNKAENEDDIKFITENTVFWGLPVKITQKDGARNTIVLDVKEKVEFSDSIINSRINNNHSTISFAIKDETGKNSFYHLTQIKK